MSTDPIDADDPARLRAEILRLRDLVAAADGREEVLADLVAEKDERIAELDERANALALELAQTPAIRFVRAVRRRLGPRR